MPNFNQAGIVDLSALKPPANAAAPAAGGSYVVQVTDATFDALVQQSMQFPIVVEFFSPRANAQAHSDMLAKLANAAGGRYLLAQIDVDAERQLAAQLQITAVPMVVGLVGGQLVPLWQGTTDEAQARAVLDQLLQLAAQNGIVGKAQPQAAPTGGEDTAEPEQAADPRFAAADEALERGDYQAAVAEFDKVLAQAPGDAEASAGRAQAALLARTKDVDAAAVIGAADAAPDDVDQQLAAADVEVLMGQFEKGFARLVAVVRDRSGDDRERARKRLLELFETVGVADPAVIKARRELTSALF